MKGIILAGGLGKRLYPLTRITNKHLLPIYNKPMIFYPVEKLAKAGIMEIIIVVGDKSAGDIIKLLGNGKEFGLDHIYYIYQEGEGGIAQALGLCEYLVKNEKIVVVLGDNIFKDDIKDEIDQFSKQKKGARILLKEVEDPERFGVAYIRDGKIEKIVEKPKIPESNLAVTGIYMYHSDVFDIIMNLKPSTRGELEITDVNNEYIKRKSLTFGLLKNWWTDSGTFESLSRAWDYVREDMRN